MKKSIIICDVILDYNISLYECKKEETITLSQIK